MFPGHVLIVGEPNSGKLRTADLIAGDQNILKNIEIDAASHSGIIVETKLCTKYYDTALKLLVDEYPENRNEVLSKSPKNQEKAKLSGLEAWSREFLSDECKELRQVLEGIMFCFNIDNDPVTFVDQAMRLVQDVKDCMEQDEGWNGFFVVLGSSNFGKNNPDVEDTVLSYGIEYISLCDTSADEDGFKTGKNRVIEVFETNEWKNTEVQHNDDSYHDSKVKKMAEMTKGLLEDHDLGEEASEIEIDTIISKLRDAKERIKTMDGNEKKIHADKVIEEIIDYV
ncbi:Piso0_003151 [Millerozyma farinosa CBS 7064]|uniref:Increased recombination centers protein 6 n=1 Tax=Pichia sorbitophila (strain ATCC MYA-4447 / BCRC 22081 / CBS 7064 / NBRC 10061 / NRRL Y-12695) TaxID=559304 RepID=G8YHB7_PICSO|nr:Piso0_003151 [Millerozyma farinosa CBS 7064]CCE80819.1 Piso0_003151 [Millerozyma farinosa CBS 7064]